MQYKNINSSHLIHFKNEIKYFINIENEPSSGDYYSVLMYNSGLPAITCAAISQAHTQDILQNGVNSPIVLYTKDGEGVLYEFAGFDGIMEGISENKAVEDFMQSILEDGPENVSEYLDFILHKGEGEVERYLYENYNLPIGTTDQKLRKTLLDHCQGSIREVGVLYSSLPSLGLEMQEELDK